MNRTHGRDHYDPAGCFGCRVLTVRFGSTESMHPRVAQAVATERQWAKDFAAYKALRKQGIQPLHADGADLLSAVATDRRQIEGDGVTLTENVNEIPSEGLALRQDLKAIHAAINAGGGGGGGGQPLDSDLTAIAALSTTPYGRALLTLADQAALVALLPDYAMGEEADALKAQLALALGLTGTTFSYFADLPDGTLLHGLLGNPDLDRAQSLINKGYLGGVLNATYLMTVNGGVARVAPPASGSGSGTGSSTYTLTFAGRQFNSVAVLGGYESAATPASSLAGIALIVGHTASLDPVTFINGGCVHINYLPGVIQASIVEPGPTLVVIDNFTYASPYVTPCDGVADKVMGYRRVGNDLYITGPNGQTFRSTDSRYASYWPDDTTAGVLFEIARPWSTLATDAEPIIGGFAVGEVGPSFQPADSDLTAIAALSTTSYGRNFLTLADQAALMGLIPVATETVKGQTELATTAEAVAMASTTTVVTPAGLGAYNTGLASFLAGAYQPLDADLTSIAAVATTAYGRALLALANQAALVALLPSYQPLDGELTALAGLTSAADRLPYFSGSGAAALATYTAFSRTLDAAADATAARVVTGAAATAVGYVAGDWYSHDWMSLGTRAVTQGQLWLMPYEVRSQQTFDRIQAEVTTAGTTTSLLRYGIWNHNTSTGKPGTLVLDAGTQAATSLGAKPATISQALSPGWYWLGVVGQTIAGSPVLRGFTNASTLGPFPQTTLGSAIVPTICFRVDGITGALASLVGATFAIGNASAPIVQIRAA